MTPESLRAIAQEQTDNQAAKALNGQHFGPHLISYVIYQHHHCQVTQPLLLEQLREWQVDISGEIKDPFHREKREMLSAGLYHRR